MKEKILLTIGRQYGSGGHEIGQRLSQMLNIDLYDKEILKESAKQSGFDDKIFEIFDEKPTNSFLYSLVMGTLPMKGTTGEFELPLPEKVFLAEFNAIKRIADEKSGIFVGRCADYALKDYSERISIFIYAPLNKRIERIIQKQHVNEAEAVEIIRKADKQRASYYNYYTTQKWGSTDSYHMCIDSSLCGIEGTANLIKSCLNMSK
jgi:cytidylate kinase